MPVDITASGQPARPLIDLCRSVDVVLLGYYPVPDQLAPAQLKQDHESDAVTTLKEIADRFRRAVDFATVDETTPTLLNIQPSNDGSDITPTERSTAAIRGAAERTDLTPDEYESEVIIAQDEDAESAILGAVEDYDTVCVGLSEQSSISWVLFGSIAERISQKASGNVGVICGSERLDRSGIDDPPALIDDTKPLSARE